MTDLTPAEQARAARWAADWITRTVQNGGDWMDKQNISGDITDMLWHHADRIDPPETVESLRAERDELWREVEQRDDELHKANGEIACLRATHTEAEAAWARIRKSVTYRTTGLEEPQPRVRDELAPNGEALREIWRSGDHSNQTPYPVVRE